MLLDMIKFQHTVFALPFAIIGAFMAAGGCPTLWQLGWILAAMVGARTCAMTFNRIVDVEYDARNPRTRSWALPTGKVSLRSAWALCILAGLLFVISAGMLNRLCLMLSPVALVVILGYSYTKRFTRYSHFVLGLSLGIAPMGSWLGVTSAFALPPFLLSFAVICWVAGFDIIYACQDVHFDRAEGLCSLPAAIGIPQSLWVAAGLHALMVLALLAVMFVANTGWLYLIGVTFVAATLVYEHKLVHPFDVSKIDVAFFTVNGFVSIVFMGLTLADILA